MKSDDPRLDLSPLDPENDPERLDRVVQGVLQQLGPALVSGDPSISWVVTRLLARHFRPLFAAASIVAISAALALSLGRDQPAASPPGLSTALVSLPSELEAWLATGAAPNLEDLLFGSAGDVR